MSPDPAPGAEDLLVSPGTTLTFGTTHLFGELHSITTDSRPAPYVYLQGEGSHEPITTDLSGWGRTPSLPRAFFVKDYSEHAGLANSLAAGGHGIIVRSITFGPLSLKAHEVLLTAHMPDDWVQVAKRLIVGIQDVSDSLTRARPTAEEGRLEGRLVAKRSAIEDCLLSWAEYSVDEVFRRNVLARWISMRQGGADSNGSVEGYVFAAHCVE